MKLSDQKVAVLDAVNIASSTWKESFNAGDASGCAGQYEVNATMRAEPFGTFTGTKEIAVFWQSLIDDGYAQVVYIEPNIEVIDSTSAVLKSG